MKNFFDWFFKFLDQYLDMFNCSESDVEMKKMGCYEKLSEPCKLAPSGEERLKQCCSELQTIIKEVLQYRDITILCGYRSNAEQEEMYQKKVSKAHGGQSAHNYKPSFAIDVIPYPIPMKNGEWDSNSEEWDKLHDLIFDIANENNIELTWGGDWKSIVDKPHYELKDWKSRV